MDAIVKMTPAEAERFEPTAKILAANGIAQSLSFLTERKYLEGIRDDSTPFSLVMPSEKLDSPTAPYWIQITQVGKPLDKETENCFTAIQKILTACFIPRNVQLLFLVNNEDGVSSMYLGIRSFFKEIIEDSFVDGISNFIKGIWPGMNCKRIKGDLPEVKKAIRLKSDYICALTGIPSMLSQYKSTYPATIDNLLSGMRKKNISYLVVAEPIPEIEIDGILYQVRDFEGRAESLKSFNYSENLSEGMSEALSKSKAVSDGWNKSTTKKSKMALVGSGLMLASAIFPPAGVVSSVVNALNTLNTIEGADLLADLSPSITEGVSHSETTTEGRTETKSYTQGKAISNNVVNKQIEAVAEHLYFHAQRYESGKSIGCWSVGVYLMAENAPDIQSASMQLKSMVSGQESIFEPIRIHDIGCVLNEKSLITTLGSMDCPIIRIKEPSGATFQHSLGKHFDDLRTVLTTKELSYYINFPLHSVPGISVVDSSPEFSLNQPKTEDGLAFGKLLYGGSLTNMEYKIPVDSLSRHALLSGINGSGKTNTVQAILNGINGLPFLVIEPAKTEYVDWALEYNKVHKENPIIIYIPGCQKYKGKFEPKPLKINPFEIVWLNGEQEPNVLTHIDRLKSTFAAAFPMYDILPVLMEDLIYTLYQNKSTDWLNEKPMYGKTLFPTLNSMKIAVDKVIESHQYEERVSRNMKACLNTRIDSLMRGWKKEMLNTPKSTPWSELFEKPTVINLSYVGDDVDKGFFMSLILQFLYEYRSALAEAQGFEFNGGCKHLTVIEEAHRVMSKCENQELPQYKTAMMFSNMLSEIRAYGEGFFLVDQVPTRLIPDAIKNTNLKITHRLVAEDDCKAIGESMGLNNEQRMVIPKLLTGQCIVSSSLSTNTYWIKANKVK